MSLSDVFIRRPVFTTVLSILVILIGVISYDRLVIREYPNIDQPVVTVSTSYSGANAEIMESQVTKPLEDALSGIEGIDVMTSNSRAGESNIPLRFNLDRNIDLAANDVR
ncbi:MAG TPA: efflux RND transporter permease subunit, partial [Alphaproteobacteria bacterium]|nr:efflux RND transporter permease subunit [Alphaproteobacteria bacterium]